MNKLRKFKLSWLSLILLLTGIIIVSSCKKDDTPILPTEEEGEENGTEYGLNDTCNEIRDGVRLIMYYDSLNQTFIGTVENTSNETIENVKVEVHLSNGAELGPTESENLSSGEIGDVSLHDEGNSFEKWSAHAETGGEGGGG